MFFMQGVRCTSLSYGVCESDERMFCCCEISLSLLGFLLCALLGVGHVEGGVYYSVEEERREE